jgi:hypothetical protein
MTPDEEPGRRLVTQSHFGTVNPEHSRTAAGRPPSGGYLSSGNETKLHQPPRHTFWQI